MEQTRSRRPLLAALLRQRTAPDRVASRPTPHDRRRRAGSKPRPYGPSCHRRRITTGCSTARPRPRPRRSKLAWYKPVVGGPCWPPFFKRTNRTGSCRLPTNATRWAKTGGEQAPPLRRFEPTPPDNDRLFPARPRPGPGFETRMEQIHKRLKCIRKSNRRGGPCWPPVLANAPTTSVLSPPGQRHGDHEDGRGTSPAPDGASLPRRRIATDCSLHVRVPSPGSELAWNKPVGAALVGRPSSPTNRTGSCRLPANAARSRRRAAEQAPPLRPFVPPPPDNDAIVPCTSADPGTRRSKLAWNKTDG